MRKINSVLTYDNTNNFNKYIVKNGKYKIGNYTFNNKENIKKCIRCMLSTIKHYEVITDNNILYFINDLATYHPNYESEIKFYINNYDIVPIVNNEFQTKYSNFAFCKVENNVCYYRNFSTNKCIDNIKPSNKNKTINDVKNILKQLTNNIKKENINNVVKNNIDKFVNNIEEIDNVNGCYMIDNFYIGRSKNILSRIVTHIEELFRWYLYDDKTHNIEKCKLILNILRKGNKLNIKILSNNQEDEKQLINIVI